MVMFSALWTAVCVQTVLQIDLPRPRDSLLASRSPQYGADWNAQGRQVAPWPFPGIHEAKAGKSREGGSCPHL